jgi:c-di-AMP phosphodiesterase-like protein
MCKNNCCTCCKKNKNKDFDLFYFILFALICFVNIWIGILVLILFIIKHVNFLEKNKFADIDLPYVVLKNKIIIHANKAANEIINFDLDKNIRNYLLDIDLKIKKQRIIINNKFYDVCIYEKQENNYLFLYFLECNQELKTNDGIIIGLIMIDNYDEALNNLEEIKKPLLGTLISRKLNEFALKLRGIVKKIEHDKYICIFSKEKLNYFTQKKIYILDQIREIDIGNETPVTLSIGIGADGENLIQTMDFARSALDLALGRGGDQVLIKDSNKFYFFGDKQKEINSNSRVRARVKSYVMSELISESSNVIAMGHKNADPDSLGACLGVYRFSNALGKVCKIILNEPNENIKYMYKKIIDENEYSNDVFINNDTAIEFLDKNTLVVIVDVHRPSLLECPEILKHTSRIIVCDHHRKSVEFINNTVMDYYEPYASSASELITEMLQIKSDIKLLQIEADSLLAGITIDTKNFTFKTGIRTYDAASYLKRKGADAARVKLFFRSDLDFYKTKLAAVNNAEIYKKNIIISYCKKNTDPLVIAQTADELLNINNISASFVLCEEENCVIISARSIGDINVQIITEKLGGGGHFTAAAAQLKKTSLEKSLELLKEAINN